MLNGKDFEPTRKEWDSVELGTCYEGSADQTYQVNMDRETGTEIQGRHERTKISVCGFRLRQLRARRSARKWDTYACLAEARDG
jgi:hypothetical protein